MEVGYISPEILALLSDRHIPQGHEVILTDFEREFSKDSFKTFLQNKSWDWTRPNRFGCALYACDLGLTQDETYQLLDPWNQKCDIVRSEDELRFTIKNGFTYRQSPAGAKAIQVEKFNTFTKDENILAENNNQNSPTSKDWYWDKVAGDKLASTLHNIRGCLIVGDLELDDLFEWDEWDERVALTRCPPWRNKGDLYMEGDDYQDLLCMLSSGPHLNVTETMLRTSINTMARQKLVHPIKDWLNKLTWDKQPRFHEIFQDTAYEAEVLRIFTLASIYRVFYPGCKWDHMLVLAGPEGVGKSSLPKEMAGKQYYQVLSTIPRGFRDLQAMEGGWWLEFPEVDAVSKADIEAAKAFISTDTDKYIRLHSKDKAKEYPRTNILIWSLNPTETGYMNDDVNRRFVIVNVKKMINLGFIKQNRDQLFAEAMELYRNGVEPYKLLEEIKDEVRQQVYNASISKREQIDVWQSLIEEWVNSSNKTLIKGQKEIFTEVLGIYNSEKWSRKEQERIGKCLKNLGFKYNPNSKAYMKDTLYSETNIEEILGFDI